MPLKNGFIFSCQVIKFCTSEPQVSTDHRDQRDQEGLPQSTLSLTICTHPDKQSWIMVIVLCPSPEGKGKKKESFAKLVSEGLTHIVHLSKEIGKLLRPPPHPPEKGKLQKLCELWGDKVGGPVSGLLPTFAGTVNTIKIKGLQSDQSSPIGMSSSLQAQNKSLIQHSKGFCLPNVRNKHKTFYHVTFMTLEESSHPALRLLSATDKSHQ